MKIKLKTKVMITQEEHQECIDTICELNEELYEKYRIEGALEYSTNGFCANIVYNGFVLWTSEFDDRIFDEDSNTYEPFLPYIRRAYTTLVQYMAALKL